MIDYLNDALDSIDFNEVDCFSFDGLSERVVEIVNKTSAHYNVHKDKTLFCMLGACCALTGRKVSSVWNGYTNYPQLWGCIVDERGTNKSELQHFFFKPISDLDSVAGREYNRLLAEWKKAKVDAGDKPILRNYLTNNSTPEALFRILSRSLTGTCILYDELQGFFNNIGRYAASGRSSEIQDYLSMWSNKPVKRDRMSEDEWMGIETPVLSIFGGTQPKVAKNTFGKLADDEDGFLDRWLFVAPDYIAPKPMPMYGETIPDLSDIRGKWSDIVNTLSNIEPGTRLEIGKDAYCVFVGEYNNRVQAESVAECRDDFKWRYMAKNPQNIIRIAMVAHLLNHPDCKKTVVSVEEANFAVNAMHHFNNYAMALYAEFGGVSRVSKGDVLRLFCNTYEIKSRASLAELIGKSPAYITKVLNKY